MFGNRYFGPRYFGDRYFGQGGVVVGSSPDIITTSLPQAFQGVAYSASVAVLGGDAPITWSVVSGTLPAWATLNTSTGAITGTPSGTGTAFFTIRATDVDLQFDEQALSILTTPVPTGTITPFVRRRRS